MDHSENDKRFCVYVLKDSEGNVCYVGSGNEYRPYIKNRSNNQKLKEKIHSLRAEVVKDGLSKNESIDLELDLYLQYKDNGHCLNRQRPAKVRPIPYDLVSKWLYYDETSPTFLRWKVATGAMKAGDPAGKLKKEDYPSTKLLGVLYRNHRIIYALMNCADLDSNLVVDHIDRDRSNNNIRNLRLVTHKVNSLNSARKSELPVSGIVGVYIRDSQNGVTAKWQKDFKSYCKTFNFERMFPDLPREVAKQKVIEIAAWYKEQMDVVCGNKDTLLTTRKEIHVI